MKIENISVIFTYIQQFIKLLILAVETIFFQQCTKHRILKECCLQIYLFVENNSDFYSIFILAEAPSLYLVSLKFIF